MGLLHPALNVHGTVYDAIVIQHLLAPHPKLLICLCQKQKHSVSLGRHVTDHFSKTVRSTVLYIPVTVKQHTQVDLIKLLSKR